jgi:hypothetical protein
MMDYDEGAAVAMLRALLALPEEQQSSTLLLVIHAHGSFRSLRANKIDPANRLSHRDADARQRDA